MRQPIASASPSTETGADVSIRRQPAPQEARAAFGTGRRWRSGPYVVMLASGLDPDNPRPDGIGRGEAPQERVSASPRAARPARAGDCGR